MRQAFDSVRMDFAHDNGFDVGDIAHAEEVGDEILESLTQEGINLLDQVNRGGGLKPLVIGRGLFGPSLFPVPKLLDET